MTKIETLLFGSIGTIVETSELQRKAFNLAFKEFDFGWQWDSAIYKDLLAVPGGRRRIEDFANARGTAVDAKAIHKRKTEIYNQMMLEAGVEARPGVAETIAQAREHGITLGFVTTTVPENTDAIFKALDGQIARSDFAFVGHNGMVENGKPAPDIYLKVREILDIDPDTCLAIEDTAPSMAAAVDAGLACIAYPGAYADMDAFDGGTHIERQKLSLDSLSELLGKLR